MSTEIVQQNDNTAAMWCHLAGIAGIVPFCNIFAPLVVWLSMRDRDPSVDLNGKEALNFQMTMSAIFVAMYFLSFLGAIVGIFLPRGFLLVAEVLEIVCYLALAVFWSVVVIKASIAAYAGRTYRYPLTIRLVT